MKSWIEVPQYEPLADHSIESPLPWQQGRGHPALVKGAACLSICMSVSRLKTCTGMTFLPFQRVEQDIELNINWPYIGPAPLSANQVEDVR